MLGDWNSQTITYNNAPALNDKTLDYQYMEANSTWYAYKDCLTVVTDNLSGKKLFYHFNDYGNCISVNDQLGYACFAKYTDSNPINHPETISKMQRSVAGLPGMVTTCRRQASGRMRASMGLAHIAMRRMRTAWARSR